jgi:phytoene dehydrogenase-like protein
LEDSAAVGVQFEDDSEQRADVVISAADGYTTIFKMLQGQFVNNKIRDRYQNWKPFPPMIFAGVGVNRLFPDSPHTVEGTTFELPQPVNFSGKAHTDLHVRIHNIEPGFAPAGKTVLTSSIECDYEFWKALAADPAAYAAEKEKISMSLISALEQIWPGISSKVEMVDIATPHTFERYTSNFRGSITGWELTPQQGGAIISKSLPGLKNFWMAGQWVYPGGGLPGGVSTAREVIRRQCGLDKKQFVAKAVE